MHYLNKETYRLFYYCKTRLLKSNSRNVQLVDSSFQPCDLLRVIHNIHWKQILWDALKSDVSYTPELFNWLQLIGENKDFSWLWQVCLLIFATHPPFKWCKGLPV